MVNILLTILKLDIFKLYKFISDSSNFYWAFGALVTGLGLVRGWLSSGALTAISTTLGASFSLITLAIATYIFIQLSLIYLSSPSGSAYFGIWANTLPLPLAGIIVGYNTCEPPDQNMSSFTFLIYSAIKAVNTNGNFVSF